MSSDGRWVAYSRPMVPAPVSVSDAALWDASDGSTVALTDGANNGAPRGSVTDPPFVSNDGSTVVFTTTVPVVAGQTNTGKSVFRYSTDTGVTEQLEVPASFGEGPIDGASTSGDGSLVVISYGDKVLTWTAAAGFSELTDPSRIDDGSVHSFSAVGAPVSDDGRFVGVIALLPAMDGEYEALCRHIELYDLDEGGVALSPCIDKLAVPWPGVRSIRTPILTTTDLGEVVIGQVNLGIRKWSQFEGLVRLTSTQVFPWAASPDGNAVGFSAVQSGLPSSEGAGYLDVIEPSGRARLGTVSYRTRPVGIGAGAETVLVSSNEPAAVGAGPDDRRALYVWTRTG